MSPPSPAKPARKPPRPGWVGPLVSWELVRLARRGQDFRARFILAAGLFAVLTLFTIAWFPRVSLRDLFLGTSQLLSLDESARFAEQFALAFMLAQLSVLCLLAPAYAAGGIAEEKERKTFVFLLVSDLTAREIVLGKFVGRVAFLIGVMLAGLPVLALTLLYGGVSIRFLLVGYLVTTTTVVFLTAIGIAAACFAATFRGAMFRAYGFTALHVLAGCGIYPLLSPIAIVAMLFSMESNAPETMLVIGLGYAAGQLGFAGAALFLAVRSVRQQRSGATSPNPGRSRRRREAREDRLDFRRPPPPLPPAWGSEKLAEPIAPQMPAPPPLPVARAVPAYPHLLPEQEFDPPRRRRPRRPQVLPKAIADRPPIDDADPFLWKETYVSGHRRDADDDSLRGLMIAGGITVGAIVGIVLFIAALIALVSGFDREALGAVRGMLTIGGAIGTFAYLLVVGSGACGGICRERQKMTLESLLTIPCDRRLILWPKWRVAAMKGWWWGLPAVASLPLGLLAWSAALPRRYSAPPDVHGLLLATLFGTVFAAALVPLAASYGLWLSSRCQTVTRAILWFLPVAAVASIFPIVVYGYVDGSDGLVAAGLYMAAAGATVASAILFWNLAHERFEREGRD